MNSKIFLPTTIFLLILFYHFTNAQTRYIDIYIATVEDNITGEYYSDAVDWTMKITSKKLYLGSGATYTFTNPRSISWNSSWSYAMDDKKGIKCRIAFQDIDGYSRKIIIKYTDLTFIYFGTEE